MPSKLRMPSPPPSCIWFAKVGDTTASMAAAITGMSNWWSPMVKSVEVMFGLMVTSPGTMATSSKP